ncbi:efflux RND transporter permease subunit [Cellulomonas sp. H30R-01]|uniref:efflux RND transporter permease subunit n=1 Tax=Cellulomonas sp. H30R-01 TaxID=2704467 RepID=UPI00138DADD3|nr:efflux RND transporter permease subunit [Cellulomonas sp. H30R-01]QHT56415.1 efflux RND transporter permease subunit [Cellulomonas sp. H30R-01]
MDRLARLSLANRAVVALMTVAVAVFGVVSLGSLRQELIPSLQIPTAVVLGVYPGSAPQIVENQVTVPVEAAAKGVDKVEEVTSTSSTGLSVTTVEFTYGTDMDLASQQLASAVNRIQRQLPSAVEPQVVTGSIDDLPVIQLAVSGGSSQDDLAAFVTDVLQPRLEQVADVRSVAVSGIADQEVLVDLDVAATAAAGLSPAQVTTVLQDNGVVIPAGTVADGDTELSVQIGSPITTVEDLAALPLSSPTGDVVALGDIATVEAGPAAPTSYSRLDGAPSLGVAVTKTPAGNTVEVSHAVQDVLDDLAEQLDADGVRVAVVFDQAPFIEESIEGLATEGLLGLLFAVIVILLFLASLRSTLVSAISIPLSLLVTFVVMNVTGYTLNILTLGAMTIAIGRVVDDSIVVIENIKRHLSYGEGKREAILTAVREVGGAITASTVSTVAVFLPIALVGGMVGELFRPFALTVAIAMGASLLVALSIVPVLAYWFIKAPTGSVADAAEVRAQAEEKERRGVWQRAYVPTLAASLRHPVITLLVAVAVLGGTLALVPRLETNFIGDSGQDTLTVTQSFEPGTTLAAQDEAAREVEGSLLALDDVETVQTTVGTADAATAAFFGGGATPQATFAVTLDADADGVAAQESVREAVEGLSEAPSTGITVAGGDSGFGSSTVDLVVRATDTDVLADAAAQVEEAVRDVDGAAEVTNNLASDQRVVQVAVDRDAAAAVGLTETAVSGTVASLMAPSPIGTVNLGDGPVDVEVAVGDAPATVAEVEALVVPTAAGPVPLTQVASVQEVEVPTSVTRVDGERSATVSVKPSGQDVGALTTALTTEVDGLDLPPGATVEVGGVAADQADAFADLGLAMLVAIAIVYLVMVATFRSLVQPLILLVSVPFAATGALIALLVTSTPLGVPALIGLLMLIGIVVSNAIVLIDLINQYRERGRPLADAVAEGARKRLRPIVMTAAATIFALTPMAIGITGGGSFISQPLALVVIGGLVSSTLLTLVVVPVLYTLFERRGERRRLRREAAEVAATGRSGERATA